MTTKNCRASVPKQPVSCPQINTYHRRLNIGNNFCRENLSTMMATSCSSMDLTELHHPDTRLIGRLVVHNQPCLPWGQLQGINRPSFSFRAEQSRLIWREEVRICKRHNVFVWFIQHNLDKTHSISHLHCWSQLIMLDRHQCTSISKAPMDELRQSFSI